MYSLMKISLLYIMYQNIIAIPIIYHTCCVEYGYGSHMKKCCFKFNNNVICNHSESLGYNYENYNNTCNYIKSYIYSDI